jgi:hypothetical protein
MGRLVRSWPKLTYERSGGLRVLTHSGNRMCIAAQAVMPVENIEGALTALYMFLFQSTHHEHGRAWAKYGELLCLRYRFWCAFAFDL